MVEFLGDDASQLPLNVSDVLFNTVRCVLCCSPLSLLRFPVSDCGMPYLLFLDYPVLSFCEPCVVCVFRALPAAVLFLVRLVLALWGTVAFDGALEPGGILEACFVGCDFICSLKVVNYIILS